MLFEKVYSKFMANLVNLTSYFTVNKQGNDLLTIF